MFIAESTPSTITGHADTFALILTLVIGFRFNVIEYTSIDPETNTTVTVYKKGALRFFFVGFFRFREFYRSRREPVRNVRITWGFSSRRETWHVCASDSFGLETALQGCWRFCFLAICCLRLISYNRKIFSDLIFYLHLCWAWEFATHFRFCTFWKIFCYLLFFGTLFELEKLQLIFGFVPFP